nr:MAG TPA: hypothetical protein [Caudoviricetes sp.]
MNALPLSYSPIIKRAYDSKIIRSKFPILKFS